MPFFLLNPIHIAWLTTLNITLKNRYADFLTYRQLTLANATVNSSVNRLTQALWDNFDSTQKTYILQNSTFHQASYIYLTQEHQLVEYDYFTAEGKPTDYDYLNIESSLIGVNFVVRIPVAIAAKTNIITAFVKKYVFSSMTFSVETF
jgi:hypothetical protein